MVTIIQGGQKVFITRLIDGDTGDPLNLTGVTEITTCFIKTDGTELALSLTGANIAVSGNPLLGKIAITLTAVQTANLQPVEEEKLEIAITLSAIVSKVQIPNAYTVVESEC